MPRRRLLLATSVLLAAALAVTAATLDRAPAPPFDAEDLREKVLLSPVYTVDRIYRSMMGPSNTESFRLGEEGDDAIYWITGYEATMVGADGETPQLQDFMCHSNLDIDVLSHAETLPVNPAFSPRLFTLSQGQFEVDFPVGFGIPVRGSEDLSLTTQVLNHNIRDRTIEVRHKVSVRYVPDADIDGRMTALFPSSAYGLALLEGDEGVFGVANPDPEEHGPGCLMGSNASDHTYEDPLGRSFTGHWVVPPGREENRTNVTKLMNVPWDTRIHTIAVHLHPFAESLELRDLTTGETVFRSRARNQPDRIGLAEVESYTSAEGIPVYADHEYELVSVYDNTTEEDQDSMAVMYLYLADRHFERDFRASR